jgi:hypothetical protein
MRATRSSAAAPSPGPCEVASAVSIFPTRSRWSAHPSDVDTASATTVTRYSWPIGVERLELPEKIRESSGVPI